MDPDSLPPFTVNTRREGATLVVAPIGEIDLATVGEVRAAAPTDGLQRLVLDLTGVGFMDTSGIRLVVELMQAEAAGGPELHVVAPGKEVVRLFEMAGLAERLRLSATADEALR